ncbi:ribonuclease III [bacterium]
MNGNIKDLENKIGISFNDKEKLELALIHKSYAVENSLNYDNERLEFLGDSVLSLVVSNYLYKRHPNFDEGFLSKLKSKIVSKESCSLWAKMLDLGNYLFLGKGEILSDGNKKSSNLANAFEALLGAIYLDQGYLEVESFLLRYLDKFSLDDLEDDYKSKLQEIVQKIHKLTPIYSILLSTGPDHKKIFTVQVSVNKQVLGYGKGNSKKKAEQMAAKSALEDNF